MADENEDIEITFNSAAFKESLDTLSGSLDSFMSDFEYQMNQLTQTFEDLSNTMEKNFSTNTNSMSKETEKSTKKSEHNFKNLLKTIGTEANKIKEAFKSTTDYYAGLFKKAFSFLSQNIPEIGKTIEISKSIIQRNLLMPLRRELIPILQSILNWVRDNRSMFVKWGEVIVNIFKFIKTVVTIIIDLGKVLFKSFISSFDGLKSSLSDFLNLMIFKLTAFAMIIGIMLKPVFESVGKLAGDALKVVMDFLGGLATGLSKTFKFEGLTGFFNAVDKFITVLSGDGGKSINWIKGIGEVIGVFAGSAISFALTVLTGIVEVLTKLLQLDFTGVGDSLLKMLSGVWEVFSTGFKALTEIPGDIMPTKKTENKKVGDAIIKPDGTIIQTSPDDTIIATKNGLSRSSAGGGISGGTGNYKIEFGQINLNVTEGNAKQAGVNFADGVSSQIYSSILNKLVLGGS